MPEEKAPKVRDAGLRNDYKSQMSQYWRSRATVDPDVLLLGLIMNGVAVERPFMSSLPRIKIKKAEEIANA